MIHREQPAMYFPAHEEDKKKITFFIATKVKFTDESLKVKHHNM